MTTERHTLEVRGIPIEIVRKDIKNLHLGVYPPSGRVRVAAPLRLDDDAVRLAVISRLGWIRRQQAEFEKQPRQSEREYVGGESHYFEGRRYRLDVVEIDAAPGVLLKNRVVMQLRVRPGSDQLKRGEVLHAWYRRMLRERAAGLVEGWAPEVGVEVPDWGIRKMKTRWGTCNADAPRIWLNLELVKKPVECIEYIVVHELVHLVERHHNDRFRDRMDALIPNWRSRRALLNQTPLAHENWTY